MPGERRVRSLRRADLIPSLLTLLSGTPKMMKQWPGAACGQIQGRQRDRQIETAWPGTSRIEIKHPASGLDQRLVRMAGNDHVNPARHRIEQQVVDVMKDVDGVAAKADRFGLRIIFRPRPLSTFPLIAITGAIRRSLSMTSGRPMSPAWMIRSTPASRCSASGRSNPCVSEITPILSTTPDPDGLKAH